MLELYWLLHFLSPGNSRLSENERVCELIFAFDNCEKKYWKDLIKGFFNFHTRLVGTALGTQSASLLLGFLVGKLRKSMMQSPCRPVIEIEMKPLILLPSLRHAVLCFTQSYFLWWAILQILTSSVDHYSEIGCCVTFCCLLSILTLMWWRPGTAVKYYSDPRELVIYWDLSCDYQPANWLQWVLPYFIFMIHWHFLITPNHHFCFFLMKLRLPSRGLIFAKLCNLFIFPENTQFHCDYIQPSLHSPFLPLFNSASIEFARIFHIGYPSGRSNRQISLWKRFGVRSPKSGGYPKHISSGTWY